MSDNRRQFLKESGFLALGSLGTNRDLDRIPESANQKSTPTPTVTDIIVENADLRLVIGPDGIPKSLIHKPTAEECLAQTSLVPMFTLTQYRPYDNELQLSYPAKSTSFSVERVHREGDNLIVSFARVGYDAIIRVKTADTYIGFTLKRFEYKGYTKLRPKKRTPIDEAIFLQLPVRHRKYFGDWLNVIWDDDLAISVLATDPFARIDAISCENYRVLQAGAVDRVRSDEVGAALIVTATKGLLNRIAQIEDDYNLPLGVKSRRSAEYKQSYYEILETTPQDIERHIDFASRGGFRAMELYYRGFANTAGHFAWRHEYPNGMQDLRSVVDRILTSGITPGIHIHYNKADKHDKYVSPRPDPRLNLSANFTLRVAIDKSSTAIVIEENPRLCTLDEGRRILKVEDELISYERYTTNPPFQFLGCQRGFLGSQSSAHEAGCRFGLLDVDTWPLFVRFTQDTDIQDEVASRLAEIYSAGFKFVYFDGAEDVPGPDYWYTVSRAQWLVYRKLDPRPIWSEGACKSHFSWHILSRGNAFDTFKPEVFKAAIRAYPAAEAARAARDFTSINFGWIGYWAPGATTIGTQPDMLEYATSRAAGWDCPISLIGDLKELEAHPRTPDNLEVTRRWEDIRATNWLTKQQKISLRNLNQEHTLLIDEYGRYELLPCVQIEGIAGRDRPARAFIFERNGKIYVVYWHMSGGGKIRIPMSPQGVRLMAEFAKSLPITGDATSMTLPLASRMYLECNGPTRSTVLTAFRNAQILD